MAGCWNSSLRAHRAHLLSWAIAKLSPALAAAGHPNGVKEVVPPGRKQPHLDLRRPLGTRRANTSPAARAGTLPPDIPSGWRLAPMDRDHDPWPEQAHRLRRPLGVEVALAEASGPSPRSAGGRRRGGRPAVPSRGTGRCRLRSRPSCCPEQEADRRPGLAVHRRRRMHGDGSDRPLGPLLDRVDLARRNPRRRSDLTAPQRATTPARRPRAGGASGRPGGRGARARRAQRRSGRARSRLGAGARPQVSDAAAQDRVGQQPRPVELDQHRRVADPRDPQGRSRGHHRLLRRPRPLRAFASFFASWPLSAWPASASPGRRTPRRVACRPTSRTPRPSGRSRG